MDIMPETVKGTNLDEVFPNGGEMGAKMRSHDWSSTPLGAVQNWSLSLRTSVNFCLASCLPVILWWGAEAIAIFNDACLPILGANSHSAAFGQPGRLLFSESWDKINLMLEGVFREGKAVCCEDIAIRTQLNGYIRERYFTFSGSPI